MTPSEIFRALDWPFMQPQPQTVGDIQALRNQLLGAPYGFNPTPLGLQGGVAATPQSLIQAIQAATNMAPRPFTQDAQYAQDVAQALIPTQIGFRNVPGSAFGAGLTPASEVPFVPRLTPTQAALPVTTHSGQQILEALKPLSVHEQLLGALPSALRPLAAQAQFFGKAELRTPSIEERLYNLLTPEERRQQALIKGGLAPGASTTEKFLTPQGVDILAGIDAKNAMFAKYPGQQAALDTSPNSNRIFLNEQIENDYQRTKADAAKRLRIFTIAGPLPPVEVKPLASAKERVTNLGKISAFSQFVKAARDQGASDEDILNTIIRNNPDMAQVLRPP